MADFPKNWHLNHPNPYGCFDCIKCDGPGLAILVLGCLECKTVPINSSISEKECVENVDVMTQFICQNYQGLGLHDVLGCEV